MTTPRVVVVEYDPQWPQLFESLRSSVLDALGDLAHSIEHVGSTSVPGLAAKPIIDMDVIVATDDLSEAIRRIEGLGYQHRGNLGIAEREAFHRPAETPPHHLYLCPVGSQALANHLAVRDYLRANPEASEAYGNLKKRLACEYSNDIDGYVEAKTEFIVGILRKAGFESDKLSDIEAMNRRPG